MAHSVEYRANFDRKIPTMRIPRSNFGHENGRDELKQQFPIHRFSLVARDITEALKFVKPAKEI